ncbi:hypothetical protein BBP40_006101 [Aspergillus hancockii]|nr:hypothetical protein BBP40_006101 [Aspergillus hancockii]
MASTPSPYSSESAFPILAHSLLTQPCQNCESTSVSRSPNWNLKDDVRKAYESPTDSVFRSGIVIGLSKLKDHNIENDGNDLLGQVTRSILTAQLRKHSPSATISTKAYIIHPASLDIFAAQKLLASLLSTSQQQPLSRDEAISCLDSVLLFPVFDFAAAVQAIGEISDTLNRYREERQQTESAETNAVPVFFVIAGLDTLAEGVIRASSAVRGTAVLSNTLRTLTQLSRTHSSCLSVILVNTSGLGTTSLNTHAVPGQMQQTRCQGSNTQHARENGVHSIFHTGEMSMVPSLLMRTLEQGIDCHVLLSKVKSTHVVEVIKDREGDGLGRWCIWDTNEWSMHI